MAGLNVEVLSRNATSSVQRMTGPQRTTFGLALVAIAIGVFLVTRVTNSTPMTTLYADLESTTAAAIVAELDAQGVPYELAGGGRIIQVPSDQVHAMRLNLSAQGLPDGSEGWSILDDQGITTSAFDQRVGYQRAMEGELAKTISAIDGVASANVHLAIPEHDLIVDDGKQASASVLLMTNANQSIAPMQVDAIVNLVASSVEGLNTDQVSVADQSGQVLAAPGQSSSVVGLEGDSQLRAKRDYESSLEADIESMLAAVVGPGLAVVTVAADLDFDSVVTVTEQYQPNESADGTQMMLAETTRNELYRGEDAGPAEGGELAVELPDDEGGLEPIAADADDESLKYSLDERDATYAVDKVITNSESGAGEVTSLSVAVLLDEDAVDAAKVGDIESLVSAAAGINPDRGDTVAVSLMPLSQQFREAIDAAAAEPTEAAVAGLDIVSLVRTVLAALVALVVILKGLRYLSRSSKAEVSAAAAAELEAGEDEEEDDEALGAGRMAAAELPEAPDEEAEPPEVKLQSLLANQSDDVAGVLRSWLNETEEVLT